MKVLRSLAIFAMATGFAATLLAQATTGNIYGKVTDEQGGVLPGVTVTLSGVGAPQTTTTGGQGEFRFLNLSPGTYTIKTELSGFATVERSNVSVNLGTNTELTVPMKIAAVATTITVTSETPLLDTRKESSGSQFNQQELKSIPTARDPWVILQQVPGVLVDRMNVGGSQSGQQDNYVGKGTDPTQNNWNVDGVTITDMAALGSSPTYYDFDAFQEMQATTGGTDVSVATPGVTLNMVTKRGTNDVHGSARVFITDQKYEAFNIPAEAKAQGITKTDRIDGIQDYGVEAGGPIVQDKAWIWGTYGRNQINLLKTGGTIDRTTLENAGGKLNVQPIESNSATLFFFRGDKIKQGRNAGVTRPQETSWDQSGPTTIWKGDDSQVFGPNLVANVAYSYVGGGFALAPEGGLNPMCGSPPVPCDVYRDPTRVWHRSFLDFNTNRPQHQVNANASYFFNTGSLGHELKVGFNYRTADVKSHSAWPGSGNVGLENKGLAKLTRAKNVSIGNKYWAGYLADTITASNLTVNVGVRYDYGYGQNLPSSSPANPVFPDLLPTLSYPGGPIPFKTKNWSPRVGLTYALGAEKKTLLRASYARYADQGGSGQLQYANPVGYQYLYYHWTDANGDHTIQPGELGDFSYAYGIDPNNTTATFSPNVIDPNLKAPTTDEIMVGVDHEIMPNFVAGLTYTYRYRKNLLYDFQPFIGITGADYVQTGGPVPAYDANGNFLGNTGPIYGIAGGYTGNFGGFETNRQDYHTTYNGVELQLTKRLSNRWMAHASFTYTDWKQHVDNVQTSCINPTNQVFFNGNTCADGDIVYFGGAANSGSFTNVYINSKWAFNVNGLYQLPLNFNISGNLYGRQGYPIPYYVTRDANDGTGNYNVAVGNADSVRNDNVYQLDLRVEKVVPLFQKADLTLSIDMFNTFNSNTILQRRADATPNDQELCSSDPSPTNCASVANNIAEIQSPRVLRFGARISF
jgi:hypothetical protein